MSELGNAEAVERGAFLTSELDRFLQIVCEMAKAATTAKDCIIQLHPQYTAPMEPPATVPPELTVGRVLLDFARDINAEPAGATRRTLGGSSLTHMRRLRIGGQWHVFFGVVLVDDNDAMIGTFTLAFDEAAWARPDRAENCLWMGRNAEMLLKTFGSKLGLELDLLAVNKRVSRLQRLAQMDPLSGLENSASFEEKVRDRLGGSPEPAAFILVDIDHFKTINDLYGHQFGDTYLKCIASAIASAFPQNAIVGRLGGDEFAVFVDVPARGQGYLDSLLSQCRSAIQRSTALLGKPDLGRVSIGAAFYPVHASTYETLYELSDTALYASKNSGRSVTTIFNQELHERYNNRELGKRFRAAVSHNKILPVFQPVIDLASGDCMGFEVLSRWHDSARGTLEPEQFQAVFSDYRLAEQLTRTIVQQALDGFLALREQAPGRLSKPHTLAFNLTSFDLMNREFVFEFQAALADFGVDWSSIIIEVTETVMLGERNGQVFRSLEELRMRGAKVALDDFATGYGGLRHLRRWPIDILKVDRAFIANLGADRRDRSIVEAIIAIADTFGFEVIAEGVETPEQAQILRELRCDFAQGYLFGRPMRMDQLRDLPDWFDLDGMLQPERKMMRV